MTSIVSLSHLKSDPAPSGREPWDDAPASSSDAQRAHFARIAHPGGKMTTNKEEALAKFLLKRQAGKAKLSAAQAEALDRALRGTAFEAGAEADDEAALTAVAREKLPRPRPPTKPRLRARARARRPRAPRAWRRPRRPWRRPPEQAARPARRDLGRRRRRAPARARRRQAATSRRDPAEEQRRGGPQKRQRSLSLNDRIDGALSAR